MPVIAVRRLIQSCGILQGTTGEPTLAHADMELQRNSVGKGSRSIGHREVRLYALHVDSTLVRHKYRSLQVGSIKPFLQVVPFPPVLTLPTFHPNPARNLCPPAT